MPLTALEKSQIRRHLRYENVGFSASSSQGGGGTLGTNQSYQASSYYGKLETKLNSLQPCDEATLTGKAFGSITLIGQPPRVGDQVILTFSNLAGATGPLATSPHTLTVTCGSSQAGDLNAFALQIALAISQDTTLAAVPFQALTPYGPGSNVLNPTVEIGLTAPQTFNVAAAVSNGAPFAASIMDNGNVMPEPKVQVGTQAGQAVYTYGYLPLLNWLYAAIASATRRQGVQQADTFKARQDEVPARRALYEFYQKELANFLAVPMNPLAMGKQNARYGQIIR